MKDLVMRSRRLSLYFTLFLFNLLVVTTQPYLAIIVPLWGYLVFQAYKNGSYSFKELNVDEPPQYNLDSYDQLVRSFNSITSFKEVSAWDQDAKLECDRMHTFNSTVEKYLQHIKMKLAERQQEVSKLDFMGKTFHYRTNERMLEEVYRVAQSRSISKEIGDLEDSIKYSPNDKEEQRQMLIKMAEVKDELSSEKRMITEQMKDVRASAKLKNAQIDNSFFSSAQSRRLDKQHNRLAKEEALANLESRKTAIQYRIEELEKKVAWVKRIKDVKEIKKSNSYDIEKAS
jgi:hypothetical protein